MKPLLQRTTIKEILELPDNPTLDDVKRNYKRLVKQYHPDINKAKEAEEYMKRINQAYTQALKALTRQQQPQQPQYRYRTNIVITVTFYGNGSVHTFTGDDFWGRGGTKA